MKRIFSKGTQVKAIVLASVMMVLGSVDVLALPLGDTKGTVSAVMVLNINANDPSRTAPSFQIWLSSYTRDRHGCLNSNGYITVKENGIGVTPESYKMIFVTALTAQATGKELAVDSSGTAPCENVNTAWIVN